MKRKPLARRTTAKPLPDAPRSVADFLAQAWAIEAEASDRYREFAEQMEMANNMEVAQLFRKLERIEQKHRDQILAHMGRSTPPRVKAYRWEGAEGPETAAGNELHYLMQPWHALQIALHNEQRAFDFFKQLARARVPAEVRAAAKEMAGEEREHVELIREWLKMVSKPASGWDQDPDPPAFGD
ncbi:MAG: ferritin family protein [Betaproteobacteria bacterium]|nr:ferritin family protein [Betaproteobacteria bacterium]